MNNDLFDGLDNHDFVIPTYTKGERKTRHVKKIKLICKIVMAACFVVFAVCGLFFAKYFYKSVVHIPILASIVIFNIAMAIYYRYNTHR